MQRLRDVLLFILWQFGPLVTFLALSASFGLKAAIAGTLAFIVLDAARHLWWHIPFTRLYLLSGGLALVFGGIDLLSQTPFMLKYEGVITNVATGIAFVAGARGEKPMLQELAEQRREPFPDRPDIRHFFRLFTLIWAFYFFLKAGVYFCLGEILPMSEAIWLRSVIGTASVALMIVLSFTQGRRLFLLFQRLGLLPAVEATGTPSQP